MQIYLCSSQMTRRLELVSDWLALRRQQVSLMQVEAETWRDIVRGGLIREPARPLSARRRGGIGRIDDLWHNPRTFSPTTPDPVAPASREGAGWLRSWLEPVAVRPTREQIAEATEDMEFSALEDPRNDVCPITQQAFELSTPVTRIRSCGHVCEREALQRWFTYSTVCPLCREDIRSGPNAGSVGTDAAANNSTSTPAPAPPRTPPPAANTTALPRLDTGDALSLANRLAGEIASQLRQQPPDPSGNITVSFDLVGPLYQEDITQ